MKCIAILCLLLFCCHPVYAEVSDDNNDFWQDILIADESRYSQPTEHISENIIIISHEEIVRLPAHNVADVLQYVSGVHLDIGSGFGHPVTYSIGGADPRHVRIMIDGIDFNNQISGQSALAELPIANVQQIEIIKGPASSRWGSALGGVINIITKDAGDSLIPHGSLSYVLSEYKQRRYLADINGGYNNIGYYVFGEYAEAGGQRNYDDMLNKSGLLKGSCAVNDELNITASIGYIGADESEGPYPDPAFGIWFKQEYISRYGRIKVDYDPSETIHMQVTAKTNHQSIRGIDDIDSRSEFRDKMWGLDAEGVIRMRESDTLALGFDAQYDRLKSLSIPEAPSMHSEAWYANYTFNVGPLSLIEGIRYDANSDFDDQISPSVGIVYELPYIADTRIRASVGRGYTAPPLLWIYYDNAFFQPNPDLKVERSWNWQIGIESHPVERVWGKATLLYSDISDFIVSELVGAKYMQRNALKYQSTSIELESRILLFDDCYLTASATMSDIEAAASGENYYSSAIARNTVNLGCYYANDHGFSATLLGDYQRNHAPDVLPHENTIVWDLKLSQRIPCWKNIAVKGYVSVHNMFNSAYWNDSFYPHPRRYVECGVSCDF